MNSAITTLNQALDSQIVLEASNIPDDLVIASDIAAGAVGTSELATDAVTNIKILNSTVQSEKISYFKSTEQTGNGSEQSIAHGLARTPGLVIITPSAVASATDTFVTGTADGTNVKATVSTGAKYYFIAL